MRSKEGAKDYRFFPEPDLPPLVVDPSVIDTIRARLPELPSALKERLMTSYGLTAYESAVLVNEAGAAAYFEEVAATPTRPAKLVVNWILNELFSYLKATHTEIIESPVSARALGELVDLIVDGTISGKIAKDVLEILYYENLQGDTETSALVIVEKNNWKQIQDESEIRALCLAVLEDPVSIARHYSMEYGNSDRVCVCRRRKPTRIWPRTARARRSSLGSSSVRS
jgi:aspartyl-tRNA(Asn)/glutamyl-tRNA(Gln) amidotransferase subunit B